MRAELKELEQMIEKAAESIPGDGNVAKARIDLKNPIFIGNDIKGKFSWGHSKVLVEIIAPCKIVGFTYSAAVFGSSCVKYHASKDEKPRLDDNILLTALSSEILKKMIEEAVI